MRGLIAGLEPVREIGRALPALFQEDDLAQRFSRALDDVLAPVLCTLDNLPSYFDAQESPADFVPWLAQWMGLALDENWPVDRQREFVAKAGELYHWRGTLRGLRDLIRIYAGSDPEIEESGGCSWSSVPGSPLPGSAEAKLVVRVRPTPSHPIDATRVETIVRSAKPAHIPHEVEVTTP